MKSKIQKLIEAGIQVKDGKIALANLDRAVAILETKEVTAEEVAPKFLVMMFESFPNSEDPKGDLEAFANKIVELTEEFHPVGGIDWDVIDGKSGDMKTIKLP